MSTTTYKFKCPVCEGHVLEEVLTNATVYTLIDNIGFLDKRPEFGYQRALPYIENSKLNRYQCSHCQYIVAKNASELLNFLKNTLNKA